jgi:hypothetical protein
VATSYTSDISTGSLRRRYIKLTFSAHFNNSTGERILDGDLTSTGWFFTPASPASGEYFIFDFGTDQWIIDEVKWYQSSSSTHGTWKWQGSDDGAAWTDIGSSFTLGGATTQTQTSLNGNTTGYKLYKLQGVSGTTSTSPWLYEIEFKAESVGNRTNRCSYTLSPVGTGDRTGVITVSETGFTGDEAAVDGIYTGIEPYLADGATSGDYLRFDFGTPVLIDEATGWIGWSSSPLYPGWKWQGSPDGSSWTDIGGSFDLLLPVAWSDLSNATLHLRTLHGNTVAYRYYQILCGTTTADGGDFRFREVEFRAQVSRVYPVVMIIC